MYNHNKAQQSKNRVHISWDILYIVGLVQERCNSSALAMELHLSCTKPTTYDVSRHGNKWNTLKHQYISHKQLPCVTNKIHLNIQFSWEGIYNIYSHCLLPYFLGYTVLIHISWHRNVALMCAYITPSALMMNHNCANFNWFLTENILEPE